jgi:hypothetical protein
MIARREALCSYNLQRRLRAAVSDTEVSRAWRRQSASGLSRFRDHEPGPTTDEGVNVALRRDAGIKRLAVWQIPRGRSGPADGETTSQSRSTELCRKMSECEESATRYRGKNSDGEEIGKERRRGFL